MKPVEVEVSLELNGRQLSNSIASLKKIRKKLRYSELVINDEPPAEEKHAVIEWKKKVHDLLEVREKLDFPNLADVKAEVEDRHRISNEEASLKSEKVWSMPQRSYDRLKKMRENKRFGPCVGFGAKQDGELLGEVKNFAGLPRFHVNKMNNYVICRRKLHLHECAAHYQT